MTAKITIRYIDGAIEQLLTGASGPVAGEVSRRGERVRNAARRNAPKDTGRLVGSITATPRVEGRQFIVRVGSNLPYAIYQEEGTGPIYPKRGRFLVWPAINNSGSGNRRYRNGSTQAFVFAKRTRGVPAKHYLRDALDAAR